VKPVLGAIIFTFSALAMAQAQNGKYTGSGPANMGDPARCTPKMSVELVVENNKLKGKLDFGNRVQDIEANVAADGKFETSFINPNGHPVNITGKLGETIQVVNPIRCGYDKVPLTR
jgi:hypothetical protein